MPIIFHMPPLDDVFLQILWRGIFGKFDKFKLFKDEHYHPWPKFSKNTPALKLKLHSPQ